MAQQKGTKVGIEGGKKLAEKFRQISRQAENEIEQALVIGALRVERDAKLDAPVDTGRMRSSITHRLIDTENGAVAEVGTNVEYAPLVEFGTSKKAAQPFLMPAYLKNKNKILKDLASAMKKGAGL